MRRRSSWSIGLGAAGLVASWLFGSTPLAVVGVGFVGAGLAARLWARTVRTSLAVERVLVPGERVEGADVVLEIRLGQRRRLLGAAVTVCQRLGPLEQVFRLVAGRAHIRFEGLPRGKHVLGPLTIELTDPLGLERVGEQLGEPAVVLVRPRIPALPSLFSSAGSRELGAAHGGLRRPTGFEIHAVRDYVPGEPLRTVHWPTTARRGRLMVKELEDAAREDVAIVLDQDAAGVAGPPRGNSFDAAVRAAGALALAHLRTGRRVVIVGSGAPSQPIRLRALGDDWETALDELATIEPKPGAHVERALAPRSAVVGAREITVVTARPERVTDVLQELRRTGRTVSLVVIASETFAGRERAKHAKPELLRAAADGIPVAVVVEGVALELALAGWRQAVGA